VDHSSGQRFVCLDGLRGIAAIFVLSAHVPGAALFHIFPASYLAVDFFFALSGFVLAHAYQDKLASGMRPLKFMRARVLRLYPLYALGTALGALAYLILVAGDAPFNPIAFLGSSVTALLLLPTPPAISVQPYFLYPFDLPAWSLFFELGVNVVFALIAAQLTTRRLSALLVVCAVLLVATAVHFGSLQVGFAPSNFIGGFARVLFSFFCGVAIYEAWRKGLFERLRGPFWLPVILLIGVFAIPDHLRAIRDPLLVIVVLPAIVALASVAELPASLVRASTHLGDASYAFYAIHAPAITLAGLMLFGANGGVFTVSQTAALATVTFFIALVANAWFDLPARKWIRTNWRRLIASAPRAS
jgi:peptidoglycan/LPS O-acetylase OafA/YrhL